MDIESFIDAIEDDYLESALEKLAKGSAKDLVMVYINALEFRRAKLMRGNTVLETEHTDRDIKITLVDRPESNTDLS